MCTPVVLKFALIDTSRDFRTRLQDIAGEHEHARHLAGAHISSSSFAKLRALTSSHEISRQFAGAGDRFHERLWVLQTQFRGCKPRLVLTFIVVTQASWQGRWLNRYRFAIKWSSNEYQVPRGGSLIYTTNRCFSLLLVKVSGSKQATRKISLEFPRHCTTVDPADVSRTHAISHRRSCSCESPRHVAGTHERSCTKPILSQNNATSSYKTDLARTPPLARGWILECSRRMYQ